MMGGGRESPILCPLSGNETLKLQKIEEKVPCISVSKRNWFFNSMQDWTYSDQYSNLIHHLLFMVSHYCKNWNSVKTKGNLDIWNLTESCAYMTDAFTEGFNQQRSARTSKHRRCQRFIAGSAFLTPCHNQDKMSNAILNDKPLGNIFANGDLLWKQHNELNNSEVSCKHKGQ